VDQGGQLTVDLLFATLIIIIAITSIVSITTTGIATANGSEISKAKVLSDDVARSVNTVISNGYGQYLVLELPGVSNTTTTDFKYNYAVKVDNSGVTVVYMGKNIESSIIPNNNLKSDQIMLPGEIYNISNDKGKINFKNITT
jgi:hypothetical protein